jgi:hypothetical protein
MLLQGLLPLLVAIPFFLFLSEIIPQTHLLFIAIWLLSLNLDVFTTYRFYRENPFKFHLNERNKIFVYLTKRFGFKEASIIFPVVFEIPLIVFFALLPLQMLFSYVFPNSSTDLFACLAAGFGIAAIGHLQAAIKNNHYSHKKQVP